MTMIRFDTKVWAVLSVFLLFTMLPSCQENTTNTTPITPFFPQQRETHSDSMDALLVGKLISVNGCLRVQDNDNNDYLLIWPQDFSLNVEGQAIQIKDGTGQLIVQVGENVKVGGGEIPSEQIENYVMQTLPNDCAGPYWIMSSIEK